MGLDQWIRETVDDTRRALNAASPLDDTLEVSLKAAMSATGCEEGGALLVSDDASSLRIQVYRGAGVQDRSRLIPLQDRTSSNCAQAFHEGHTILIADVAQSATFFARSDSPILSELIVPVRSGSRIIGLLNLESTKLAHFNQGHAEAIQRLSEEVGVYWDVARLIEWRDKAQKLHRALHRVATSLIDETARTNSVVLEEALALTSADIGGVLIRSTDGEYLELTEAVHLRPGADRRIPKGQGIVWRCLGEGRPISVPDVREDPDFLDLSEGKIKSLLVVPMFDREEAIGVINIESEEVNHFSLSDKSLLELFAAHCALSLKLAALRSQYEGAASIAGLGSLSGNLTHRMNNLIGGVRVLSDLLAGELEQRAPELVPRAKEIESSATEALGVVEHYEKLFSLPEEQIDLRKVADSVAATVKRPEAVKITTRYPDHPVEYLIPNQQITDLLRELVTNALKSLQGRGQIDIEIEETSEVVRLRVSDNGPGIDRGALPQVFDRGFTSRNDRRSTGFGLWWVRSLLAMLGGTIVPADRVGGGATFTVMLPKRQQR